MYICYVESVQVCARYQITANICITDIVNTVWERMKLKYTSLSNAYFEQHRFTNGGSE